MARIRRHIISKHGVDLLEPRHLVDQIWPKPGTSSSKKSSARRPSKAASSSVSSDRDAKLTENIVDEESVNKAVDQSADDSTLLNTTLSSGCQDDQKTTKTDPNRRKAGKKTKTTFSPRLLHCGQPGCTFTVGDAKNFVTHWNKDHTDIDIWLDGGPTFLEMWSGKQRQLFDVFSFVVRCQICKIIRQVY